MCPDEGTDQHEHQQCQRPGHVAHKSLVRPITDERYRGGREAVGATAPSMQIAARAFRALLAVWWLT